MRNDLELPAFRSITGENMKAGRELDRLIAEKVMHLPNIRNWDCGYVYGPEHGEDVPRYSTDIAAAWQVVEKLTKSENIDLEIIPSAFHNECSVSVGFLDDCGDACGPFYFTEESAPHAICLAALKAIEK